MRLGITLTFKTNVHLDATTKIARDVEEMLFVDPGGAEHPIEDVLLSIIDEVAAALFSEAKTGYKERRWQPPETIYHVYDDAHFVPEKNISGLARLMAEAPRNEEDLSELEARLRYTLSGVHWKRDRVLATSGQGVSLVFLECADTDAKKAKREKLLYWLTETAELVSAAAYSEKAFCEELEKLAGPRMLDETWLPSAGKNFEFLKELVMAMRIVMRAVASAKLHLQKQGAGVLMRFSGDIWKYGNPMRPEEIERNIAYLKEWLSAAGQKQSCEKLDELLSCADEILTLAGGFRAMNRQP